LIAPTPPNPPPSTTIRGRSGIDDSSSRVARASDPSEEPDRTASLAGSHIESRANARGIARTG
jgi:hypothetical protein